MHTCNYDLSRRVDDPAGQITTLLLDNSRNVLGLIDPLLGRSTWIRGTSNRLKSRSAPAGVRATRTYVTRANRTTMLRTVTDGLGRSPTPTTRTAGSAPSSIAPARARRSSGTAAASGFRSTSVCDAAGRVRRNVNPLNQGQEKGTGANAAG